MLEDDFMFALIVEDLPDHAEVVARVLKYYNRNYKCVATAEEALTVLMYHRPSVIIADLALPEMSGWDLLKAIRETTQLADIPVVAITAYYSNKVAKEAVKAGFDAFVRKPLDTSSFLHTVDQVIGHGPHKQGIPD
jgi:two-component system CheB/CheR fusion protein